MFKVFFPLSSLLHFFFHGCFSGEIIFDRMESNCKSDNGESTDKLLTYEEAVERAGGFMSILQLNNEWQLNLYNILSSFPAC